MDEIREILPESQQIGLKQINDKIPEVTLAVDNCKTEFTKYLDDTCLKLAEYPKRNKKLASDSQQLISQLTELKEIIEKETKTDLARAESELAEKVSELEKTNTTLEIMQDLCEIHDILIEIRALGESKSYIRCINQIQSLEELIREKFENCNNLTVLNEIKAIISTERSALRNEMSNSLKDNIIMELEEANYKIRVKNKADEIQELLTAICLYQKNILPLDNIIKFLWTSFFVPAIDCVTETKTVEQTDFNVLELIVKDSTKKSSYSEVFNCLKIILTFLRLNFNSESLSYIGKSLSQNLIDLIIKNCLENTIPATEEFLKDYHLVIEATEDLQNSLIACKIYALGHLSILDYANDIDVLFINKKCKSYLEQAEKIMKKDLHQMIEIGELNDTSLLNDKSFQKCSVSKNVIEILTLTETIIKKTTKASDVSAGRLFCTVQNIFRMYTTFVPEFHRKLLQTIPQQVALFHNNCLYMAYKLSEWNHLYYTQISSIINLGSVLFKEEVTTLEKIANEKFTSYIKGQIRQIEEIMSESGLTNRQTLEKLESSTEKSIRQCLRQQELLKTVWHKVLSYSVYNRSLGEILNFLCDYLVNCVLKFEDISTDAAEQLIEVFKIVQTRGPKLFTDPKEIGLFVDVWGKLGELIFVLGASLLDINDRWADGKGLLALQFKADEVKQLIRALFQNTERRSALLAKIHD